MREALMIVAAIALLSGCAQWYKESRDVIQAEMAACAAACGEAGMESYDADNALCLCQVPKPVMDTGK